MNEGTTNNHGVRTNRAFCQAVGQAAMIRMIVYVFVFGSIWPLWHVLRTVLPADWISTEIHPHLESTGRAFGTVVLLIISGDGLLTMLLLGRGKPWRTPRSTTMGPRT